MKKPLALIALLMALSLMAACTGAPGSSSSPSSSAPESSQSEWPYYPKAKDGYAVVPIESEPASEPEPVTVAPDPAPAEPEVTPAPPPAAPAQSAFVGTFYDASGQYSPEYTPRITFFADGSFDFTVNLLEGMGNIYGGYTDTGGSVDCSVSSRNFSGFAGDTMTWFSFTVADGNTLVYNGEQVGLMGAGTVFVR